MWAITCGFFYIVPQKYKNVYHYKINKPSNVIGELGARYPSSKKSLLNETLVMIDALFKARGTPQCLNQPKVLMEKLKKKIRCLRKGKKANLNNFDGHSELLQQEQYTVYSILFWVTD